MYKIDSKTPNILIMTATFTPVNVPYLKLVDESTRVFQYFCALISWITKSNFKKIVFCENSGTTINFHPFYELASQYGKEIEFLVFKGSSLTSIYGKGYGEGEILKYVLEKSVLFKNETSFAKVTGRLFINNLEDVLSVLSVDRGFLIQEKELKISGKYGWLRYFVKLFLEKKGKAFVYKILISFFFRHNFIYPAGCWKELVDTRFFLCDKQIFEKNISYLFRFVRDHYGVFLEIVYNVIEKQKKINFSDSHIKFTGYSGTGNTLLDQDYEEEIQKTALSFMKICSQN